MKKCKFSSQTHCTPPAGLGTRWDLEVRTEADLICQGLHSLTNSRSFHVPRNGTVSPFYFAQLVKSVLFFYSVMWFDGFRKKEGIPFAVASNSGKSFFFGFWSFFIFQSH